MQVLLIEDYPALGYVGDRVQVKGGYGRNFLIPRGIAVEVGTRRAKEFNHLLRGVSAKRARLRSEAEELGRKVAAETLNFELKLGGQGKAFGSVSAREVLKQLNDRGYDFDKKQVRLHETIKGAGNYTATVQLHAEVSVEVPIVVTGIREKAEAAEGEDSTKGRKGRSRRAASEANPSDTADQEGDQEDLGEAQYDVESADEGDSPEQSDER